MIQKIIGTIVVAGLILAVYVMFFAKDKDNTNTVEDSQIAFEEPKVSTGVGVATTPNGVEYFTTKDGMALYTFTKDEFNKSNCVGECLKKWPAYYSDELLATDGFGSIVRADGVKQSTYLEKPLYTFFKDEKPGDTKGHGVKGEWYLATFSK